MANAVFKLMLYSILLNIAIGIMTTAMPQAFTDYQSFGVYNDEKLNEFTTDMNGTLKPTSDAIDTSSITENILDKIGLGIINKIMNVVDEYMFGMINYLHTFFPDTAYDYLWNFFKIALTIAYTIAAIILWTGKDVTKG